MATTTTAIWMDCSGGAFSATSPALGSGAPWTTYSRKHQLERPHGAVVQVQQRVEEVVPVADRVEQRHDRHHRFRQRDDDLDQDLPVVGAVDLGAVEQLARECS